MFPFYAIAGVYGTFLHVSGGLPRGEPYALRLDFSAFRRLHRYLAWGLAPSLWGRSFKSNLSIALFAGLLTIVRRHRQVWFGLGWFLISLLPVMFMPYRMAPNYVMIGLFGLCLVVAVAIDRGVALLSRASPRVAPYIAVMALGFIVYIGGARARFHNQSELEDGWTGRAQRLARCVASHVLTRYPAALPANIAIFRGFDGEEKWVLWGGAILNVLYRDPSIRSLFVPDLRPGHFHPLFSYKGQEPGGEGQVSIDRREIRSCEIAAAGQTL